MTNDNKQPFTVAVVGGGLVGSLAAVYFATRGWHVNVFEQREDIRTVKQSSGRSINLALSARGLAGLQRANVAQSLTNTLIPMKARMIHVDQSQTPQTYGYFGEAINSVDRKLVNQHLLSMAESHRNVAIHFNYELLAVDFDKKSLSFKRPDGTVVHSTYDLVVGADGAYSRVRRELQRVVRMNFMMEYIDHAYVELNMPPSERGEYKLDPGHLHIWPRQTFMMIALPNIDKSFTVTLFMPWADFDSIKTPEQLLSFFESKFSDALPLIGRDLLVRDYFKNPKGALMNVKCKPYHYKSSCVIIGDAAHAMVPFYGQGMNCGFEDCLVLDDIFDKYLGKRGTLKGVARPDPTDLAKALEEYSTVRNPDAEAICDLAMHNYVEMRASVTHLSYKIRKSVEGFLHRLVPSTIIPLYTMVSFTRIPYAQAWAKHNARTKWFNWAGKAVTYAAVAVGLGVGVRVWWRLGGAKVAHGFMRGLCPAHAK